MKLILISVIVFYSTLSVWGQTPSWVRRNNTGPIQTPPSEVGWQTVTINATTAWHLMLVQRPGSNFTTSYLARTTNGIDWKYIYINGTYSYKPISLSAVDANTAYVAQAISPNGSASQGEILQTKDGGQTWRRITNTEYTSIGSVLRWVHFFDATTGVAFGDPMDGTFEVYRTTNAGTTWQRVAASMLPTPFFGEQVTTGYYRTPYFALGNTIWTGTSVGRIFKSTDQGRTWTAVMPLPGTDSTWDVAFQDSNNGIAFDPSTMVYTYDDFLLRTSDGGANWEKIIPLYNTKGGFYLTNLDAIPGAYISMGITGEISDPDLAGEGSSVSTDGIHWVNIDRGLPRNRYISLDAISPTVAFATSATDDSFQSNPGAGGFYQLQGNLLSGLVTATRKQSETSIATVYPNPSLSGSFELMLPPGTSTAQVHVSNLVGQWIYAKNNLLSANISTVKVDLSLHPAGVYFIQVQTEKGRQVLRIISK